MKKKDKKEERKHEHLRGDRFYSSFIQTIHNSYNYKRIIRYLKDKQ